MSNVYSWILIGIELDKHQQFSKNNSREYFQKSYHCAATHHIGKTTSPRAITLPSNNKGNSMTKQQQQQQC
jgi:hypothetical protein